MTRLIDAYQLGEAGRQIYDFLWGEYCDWYIEMTKTRLRSDDLQAAEDARRVLVYVLEGALRLLHPYMPFVTEALWQYLPHTGEALIVARWPEAGQRDGAAVGHTEGLRELVRAIRNARTEYDVDPSRRIAALVAAGDESDFLIAQAGVLANLARIDEERLDIQASLPGIPERALTLVTGAYQTYLPLEALVDLERERQRLAGELAEVEQEVRRAESLLANENFVNKAPEAVVAREREKLVTQQERQSRLKERLEELS